ncbi:MAG TPA: hypothetical protein VFM82_07160 [Flavobacteriaceae bacterium]|nr:hypothetical protein [Flavobacteriaceae bacterium]
MKNKLFIFLIFVIFSACGTTSNKILEEPESDRMRYFDLNNKEISEAEFQEKRSMANIAIQGDSINHKRLVPREESGTIANKQIFFGFLEKELNVELDSTLPIVIIFYPGKDTCNSGGIATKADRKRWYGELEKGLQKIANKPIYIYKDKEGLEERDVLQWKPDPDGTIERLFFKHHYPCSSFVVISENGNYISVFGEIVKEYIWKAVQMIK